MKFIIDWNRFCEKYHEFESMQNSFKKKKHCSNRWLFYYENILLMAMHSSHSIDKISTFYMIFFSIFAETVWENNFWEIVHASADIQFNLFSTIYCILKIEFAIKF